MEKVADYVLPRTRLYGVGAAVAVLAGLANSLLDVDMGMRPSTFGWLLASLVAAAALHEGVHGAAAVLLGHRPSFGLRPPLVYVTFAGKLPRCHFMLVALAPFVALDLLFGFLFAHGLLRLFSDFCLIINTTGAVGDIWIALKLTGAPKGALIRDTECGFEVWSG